MRTPRETYHPTAQEQTQQAQTPAHYTGISSQKEMEEHFSYSVLFLFIFILLSAS